VTYTDPLIVRLEMRPSKVAFPGGILMPLINFHLCQCRLSSDGAFTSSKILDTEQFQQIFKIVQKVIFQEY